MLHEFERRLDTEGNKLNLFDTVDSNKKKCKTFKSVELKINLKKKNSNKELIIQRDILGTLLLEADKSGSAIDMDSVLEYPLSQVSVPLCTADGARRKTKSDLLAVNGDMEVTDEDEVYSMCDVYMEDLAAFV